MKRPEKKEEKGYIATDPRWQKEAGYNQACDDHEPYIKFLKDTIKSLEDDLQDARYELMGDDL